MALPYRFVENFIYKQLLQIYIYTKRDDKVTSKKILFFIFSVLLISSVSAFSFGDFFGKITWRAVDEDIAVSEQVKCVFKGNSADGAGIGIATSVLSYYQKCYSDDGKFSCSGISSCVVDVSGTNGQRITWKSSCGGYDYTTIDGNSEYANFDCAKNTSSDTSNLIKEQVKCVFANSDFVQNCYSATSGDEQSFSCSGVGSCVIDYYGEKGKQMTWKSSCGGYDYTTIDGNSEYANFDCAAVNEAEKNAQNASSGTSIKLDSNTPSVKFIYSGKTYTVSLLSASDSTATIKVTDENGGSVASELNEETSGIFLDVPIKLVSADETNLYLSAELSISPAKTSQCVDSDGGINLYEAGKLTRDGQLFKNSADYCIDKNSVFEFDCGFENGVSGSVHNQEGGTAYQCNYGCSNGACLFETKNSTDISSSTTKISLNSDIPSAKFVYSGKVYRIDLLSASDNKATFRVTDENGNYLIGELLEGTTYVFENVPVQLLSADETNLYLSTEIGVKGAENPQSINVGVISPNESTGPIDVPAENNAENANATDSSTSSNLCQGCLENGKCYPYGYRLDNKFCSAENLRFTTQYGANNFCENNFECGSNVCVSGNCIEPGLIQKILDYFRKLFG